MNEIPESQIEDVLRADFSDLEILCSTLQSWDLDVLPLTNTRQTDSIASIIQLRQGPVDFMYSRATIGLEQRGAAPLGRWSFEVLGENTRWFWWQNKSIDQGMILVYPEGGGVDWNSGPDWGSLTCSIR